MYEFCGFWGCPGLGRVVKRSIVKKSTAKSCSSLEVCIATSKDVRKTECSIVVRVLREMLST